MTRASRESPIAVRAQRVGGHNLEYSHWRARTPRGEKFATDGQQCMACGVSRTVEAGCIVVINSVTQSRPS